MGSHLVAFEKRHRRNPFALRV